MSATNGTAPTLKLHRKLAQVMYEAERIPKNGTAPQAMGGFKFVQVGDAADVIRKALAEHNVSMIPSNIELVGESEHTTSGGKVMTTMTVRTTWTLTDGETGETAQIQSLGSGADTGDKAAPKAQSNAMKYALLMGFLLSTGDDPEQTDTSDRQSRRGDVMQGGSNGHRPPPPRLAPREATSDGGLIGTAEVGKTGTADFELRETPDGHVLSFRLVEGRKGIKVVAFDPLASALAVIREDVLGKRVTCWGQLTDESFTKDGKTITYQQLVLERIQTPDLTLPAVEDEPELTAEDERELDAIAI